MATDPTVALRQAVIAVARSLHGRGLTHGSTGNISIRHGEQLLITPTGSSLGTVAPGELSTVDLDGNAVAGNKPSKEAFLHAAMYRARPQARAVIHTHSTYATAVSCLPDLDERDVLPALTAYHVMRVGVVPLIGYFAPGDRRLADAAERTAVDHSALLLRNHGPVVASGALESAMDTVEELEQTAKLYLLLRGHAPLPLTAEQRLELLARTAEKEGRRS